MAKRKKNGKNGKEKKPHWAKRAAVTVGLMAAGAIVGAVSLRIFDRKFGKIGTQPLLGPSSEEPMGYDGTPVNNPMGNPLAAAAISPVVAAPVAVAVPSMLNGWPGYPGNPMGRPVNPAPPPPPEIPEEVLPDPDELRRQRDAEFDDLVSRFENGDVSLH